LYVDFSDVGFNTGVTGFSTVYSGSIVGSGNTSEMAYWGSGLMDTTNPIGTVGPLNSSDGYGKVSGGGAAGSSPYSLTLDEVFTASATDDYFSVDGNITGNVPEPMSLLLLGGCLLVVGRKLAARLA